MLIVIKPGTSDLEIDSVVQSVRNQGLREQIMNGESHTIIRLLGDTIRTSPDTFRLFPCVEQIVMIDQAYRLASRQAHPEDSCVQVGSVMFGPQTFTVIGGPCAVESYESVSRTAKRVKEAGGQMLRGGAFKPRTSPYSFQGLGIEGLDILRRVKRETGLPVVTEVMSTDHLSQVSEVADIIQIGARNMHNFSLLGAVGKLNIPVLLKRGMMSTIEELLLSAEYILVQGNPNVILCERGIRTFESSTRNTLDISAVPVLKHLSHLPVIVDPSHACGHREYVLPLAKAAAAVGADGLMVEVHDSPSEALCDGRESLTPDEFAELMNVVPKIAALNGRASGSAVKEE